MRGRVGFRQPGKRSIGLSVLPASPLPQCTRVGLKPVPDFIRFHTKRARGLKETNKRGKGECDGRLDPSHLFQSARRNPVDCCVGSACHVRGYDGGRGDGRRFGESAKKKRKRKNERCFAKEFAVAYCQDRKQGPPSYNHAVLTWHAGQPNIVCGLCIKRGGEE